jgi:hypothetical protein
LQAGADVVDLSAVLDLAPDHDLVATHPRGGVALPDDAANQEPAFG